MKKGKITPNGVVLEKHESATVVFLTEQGLDVELIPHRPKEHRVKTPDIRMKGRFWEIKSPKSAGARTIEHAMRSAGTQSDNIILDLRRSKMAEEKCLSRIKHELSFRKNIRRLLVITKSQQLLDLK